MKNATPHATRKRKELVKDPEAYIEALGRHDNHALEEVLSQKDGRGTVVRLILGATTTMPTRALTYIAAAGRLMQRLPAEQLQVISANAIGEAVNGKRRDQTDPQFAGLAHIGAHLLEHAMPEVAERTVFAFDTLAPQMSTIRGVTEIALQKAGEIRSTLELQAQTHRGDFVTYTAAHVVNQDTPHLRIDPLFPAQVVQPERIVSIGCQKEKTFYAARLAVRALMEIDDLLPSVQVFTEHV
jgi:hypothetical protein